MEEQIKRQVEDVFIEVEMKLNKLESTLAAAENLRMIKEIKEGILKIRQITEAILIVEEEEIEFKHEDQRYADSVNSHEFIGSYNEWKQWDADDYNGLEHKEWPIYDEYIATKKSNEEDISFMKWLKKKYIGYKAQHHEKYGV